MLATTQAMWAEGLIDLGSMEMHDEDPVASAAPPLGLDSREFDKFCSENLSADIDLWRGKRVNITMLLAAGEVLTAAHRDAVRVLLLYQNEVLMPFNTKAALDVCEGRCNEQLLLIREELARLGKLPGGLPNALILVSVSDNYERKCRRDVCSVPLLSVVKHQDDADVLVPRMLHHAPHTYVYPWEKKSPKAIWRGVSYCFGYHHGFAKCSRSWLTYRCQFHGKEEYADVGLLNGYGVGNPDELTRDPEVADKGPIPKARHVSLPQLAKHRYLLSLDGASVATDLHTRLHINSLVLKQRSPFIEYYYRSMKPGVHFEEFWTSGRDDVYDVLARLRSEDKTEEGRKRQLAMVEAGMAFSRKFTGMDSRALYWRRAIEAVRALFPDMDDGIVSLVNSLKKSGRWDSRWGSISAGQGK